jgi:hypothetical protein
MSRVAWWAAEPCRGDTLVLQWHEGGVARFGAELGNGGAKSEESSRAQRSSYTREKNEEAGSDAEEECRMALDGENSGSTLLTHELQ